MESSHDEAMTHYENQDKHDSVNGAYAMTYYIEQFLRHVGWSEVLRTDKGWYANAEYQCLIAQYGHGNVRMRTE